MRKAAVFCIVGVHSAVGGGAVEPHLSPLNATKMKLLRMYITRAQGDEPPATEPASPN